MSLFRRIFVPVAVALAVASSSMPAAARRPATRAHHVDPAPPAPAPCLQFYLDRQAPAPVAPDAPAGQIFCHSFYALSFSTALRDPLWTSYQLTAAMVEGSSHFERASRSTFDRQPGLTPAQQGSGRPYSDRRYQRGHMTPDNDAGDAPAQADTYVVTNIVPQAGRLNMGIWKALEAAVHQLGADEGAVFIVTGPLFEERRDPVDGVAVPSSVFKAIFVPSRNFALAFVAANDRSRICRIVPISDIARRAGIDPFPSLAASVKARLPVMPPGWGDFPPACQP